MDLLAYTAPQVRRIDGGGSTTMYAFKWMDPSFDWLFSFLPPLTLPVFNEGSDSIQLSTGKEGGWGSLACIHRSSWKEKELYLNNHLVLSSKVYNLNSCRTASFKNYMFLFHRTIHHLGLKEWYSPQRSISDPKTRFAFMAKKKNIKAFNW